MRSGQSIFYPQGDVTVMGSVASGAEVIAGGSIHVYGALRGRAIAGVATAGRPASSAASSRPNSLAIDGLYKTADDMRRRLRGRPVQAWLDGDDHAMIGSPGLRAKQEETSMAKVLVVTSGKGGVGKTTSTAALGAALAQSGQNVVVVDFDVGLRNLDLVMGAERRVVYDLINVVQGDAKLAQALIRDKRVETLCLLPASQTRDKDALTEEGVARVIDELREQFDWVICDSPAGIERGATLAMRYADVGGRRHQPGSLLGARQRPHHRPARLQDRARREGRAHGEAPAAHPLRPGARRARRDAEDRRRAGDPLDPAARHHPGERGGAARLQHRLARHRSAIPTAPPASAYVDAARRLQGETSPMSFPCDRRGLLGKLFGRRAA